MPRFHLMAAAPPADQFAGGAALSAVPQLARFESDIGRTAGAWSFSSGTSPAAMIDETLSDGTTTEVASPSTTATHYFECKIGANWNGTPLARPISNADAILRVDLRCITAAIVCTAYLYEGTTLRDTWNVGTVGVAGGFTIYRRLLAGAVIDAITDFTDLRLRVEWVGVSSGIGACTYASFYMNPTNALTGPGLYVVDFATAGLTDLPRCFELNSTTSAVPPVPLVGTSVDLPSVSYAAIMTCFALALPIDCYAEATAAPGFDGTEVAFGGFVHQAKAWLTPGTDNLRYNCVPSVPLSEWEIKMDGGPGSPVLANVGFATVPALVAGERIQTRQIGTVVSARKNGSQILSYDDFARPALPIGHAGMVMAALAASSAPWPAISKFEMGSL